MILKRKIYSTTVLNKVTPRNIKSLGKRTLKRSLVRARKVKDKAYMAAINPGKAASDLVGEVAKRPLSVTAETAGIGTMLVDPTGVGLIPMGSLGTGAEIGLRKLSPKYAKLTNKLHTKYNKSKAPEYIEKGVNSAIEVARRAFSKKD